jgi:hypothetical protein
MANGNMQTQDGVLYDQYGNPVNTPSYSGQPQQWATTTGGIRTAPQFGMPNLGEAALVSAGAGTGGVVYNPTPQEAAAGGSAGVGKYGGGVGQYVAPTSSTGEPQIFGPTVAGVMHNEQQAKGAQVYQQYGGDPSKVTPSILNDFYNMGVQLGTIKPVVSGPTQGGTPTPVIPAGGVSATALAGRAPTPWATAPAAPGIQIPQNVGLAAGQPPAAPGMGAAAAQPAMSLAAHNSALADAGKALFAHYGGDPDSASPANIANFHKLFTNAIGNYTAGAGPGGAPATSPPKPMMASAGGLVPGRGNQDTVPALLTPGEYVIPKSQVAQAFGARTPVRMQSGGPVQQSSASGQQSGPGQLTDDQWRALIYSTARPGFYKSPQDVSNAEINFNKQFPMSTGSGIASTVPGQTGGVPLGQIGSMLSALQPQQGQQQQPAPQQPPITLGPRTPTVAPTQVPVTAGATQATQPSTAATPYATAPPVSPTMGGTYLTPPPVTLPPLSGQPIRMQSGGFVPDDQQPPETRRRAITTSQPSSAQPTQPSSQPSSAPAAPGGSGGYTGPTAAQIMAQNAAANNRIGSGGAGSIDALGTLGDEPMISSMGIGAGSGPGSGMPTQQATSVIGGLASGLASAAQKYADSVGKWRMQQSAPMPVSSAQPATQFEQNQLPQPRQQMMAAQYGYNPYLT